MIPLKTIIDSRERHLDRCTGELIKMQVKIVVMQNIAWIIILTILFLYLSLCSILMNKYILL
ncbi:hypothetical protein C1645_793309, partial [Glomus cerebriforme]